MDTANLAATWVSTIATVVGLGALYNVVRQFPPPLGPDVRASLEDDFCGYEVVYLTPSPLPVSHKLPCQKLFGVIHPAERLKSSKLDSDDGFQDYSAAKEERDLGIVHIKTNSELYQISSWNFKHTRPMIYHEAEPQDILSNSNNRARSCVSISRTTLMTMLVIQSVRVFQHLKGTSGLRCVFRGYTGIFTVDWPLGSPATVRFANLDTRTARIDVYPRGFYRNVKHAINMLCGIVEGGVNDKFCVGVCGRKAAGIYLLHYSAKAFTGRVAARDLYDTMGGNVYKPDFLSFIPIEEGKNPRKTSSSTIDSTEMSQIPPSEELIEAYLVLDLPALDGNSSQIYIAPQVQKIVAEMMDKLPWTQLAWSMHRGLKDLVVSYGNHLWSSNRKAFASTLRRAVHGREHVLIQQGWCPDFVHNTLPQVLESGIIRNKLSLTRAVTSVTLLLCKVSDTNNPALNETNFWRNHVGKTVITGADPALDLDIDTMIALAKLYTVQCSYEFDYGIYIDFPPQLIMA